MKTKICTGKLCNGEEKPLSKFSKNFGRKDDLQSQCKDCVKEYKKEYNDKNKEKIAKWQKEHYEENKEEILKQQKDNYEKNFEKIAKQKKEYAAKLENKAKYNNLRKNRRKTDPNFKILGNLRIRIWKALKGNNKSLSTMFLIGCEVDYLMYYIQEKFTEGMTWDNYGDWHMDHIKPCTKFDLSKPNEQLKCFNYTNLQPLWMEDNLKKGNKYLTNKKKYGIL